MAKSACFQRGLFINPVKSRRCTTEPVGPVDGINKDVGGAKLLLMTTSVSVSCGLYLFLPLTEDTATLSVS